MYVDSLTQVATGWYTAATWDAIRAAVSASFHKLLGAEAQRPAPPAGADRRRPAAASAARWPRADDSGADDSGADDSGADDDASAPSAGDASDDDGVA